MSLGLALNQKFRVWPVVFSIAFHSYLKEWFSRIIWQGRVRRVVLIAFHSCLSYYILCDMRRAYTCDEGGGVKNNTKWKKKCVGVGFDACRGQHIYMRIWMKLCTWGSARVSERYTSVESEKGGRVQRGCKGDWDTPELWVTFFLGGGEKRENKRVSRILLAAARVYRIRPNLC